MHGSQGLWALGRSAKQPGDFLVVVIQEATFTLLKRLGWNPRYTPGLGVPRGAGRASRGYGRNCGPLPCGLAHSSPPPLLWGCQALTEQSARHLTNPPKKTSPWI